MAETAAICLPVESADDHRWQLLGRVPPRPQRAVLWLPLGVAARHYLPFAGIRAVLLAGDWYAPRSSLQFLLCRVPQAIVTIATLDANMLGTRADLFAWMSQPERVVDGSLNDRLLA